MTIPFRRSAERALAHLRGRSTFLKAISFALIGVVNTFIDAGVFFLVFRGFRNSPDATAMLERASGACGCVATETLTLITANVIAWAVAVSCSYVMNSFITFAAESGRRLRVRDYRVFVGSGIAGVILNTLTLVLAARVFPVWVAKGLAILVSFLVNFSLARLVVFRPRPDR